MRRWAMVLGLLVMAASCDSGIDAPDVGSLETSCIDLACIEFPGDWSVDVGDGFVALAHPDAPGMAFATVGSVDMEALTVANGGTWPAPTSEVVRAFWDLIGGGEDAELYSVEPARADGSVRSDGELDGLRMWYRLVPSGGSAAIGVEVRAPNSSWQPHADVIIESLRPGGD